MENNNPHSPNQNQQTSVDDLISRIAKLELEVAMRKSINDNYDKLESILGSQNLSVLVLTLKNAKYE